MTSINSTHSQIEQDYQHNFRVNLIDGVLFFFGISFLANNTILPLYVSRLTDNPFYIGLLATVVSAGYLIPQLFTANWVQRQPLKKSIPIRIGLVHIRLPIFLLAATPLLAIRNPQLALILFFIFTSWQIFGAGTTLVSWQDMIAKIFPVERRGRFMGLTRFLGTGSGVLAAGIATWILDYFVFPYNYALCFLIAAVFILFSRIFLARTREDPQPSPKPPQSQIEFWRQLPMILKSDRNFRNFIISRIVATGNALALGFLAVYAVERWQLSDSQAGLFTTFALIGSAGGYLLFGWFADKFGHKLGLELGYLASIAVAALAFWAPAPAWFYLIFFLTGISMAGFSLSGFMIIFEFSDPEDRPVYIGLANTIIGIFSAIAPLIGSWIVSGMGYHVNFGITFVVAVISLILLHWTVAEPRNIPRTKSGELA